MPVLLALALLAQTTIVNPAPLDASDPRAKTITEFVNKLTTGDLARAVDTLRTSAAPDSPAAKNPAEQLQPFESLANSGMFIDRIVEGVEPGTLVVLLGSGAGGRGGRSALIFELEPAAPHRIRALKNMMVRRMESRGPVEAPPTMGEDITTQRANALVAAINSNKESDRRAFIESAWNLELTGQTVEAALGLFASFRHRLGEGLKITGIEKKPSETLVHVVDKDGRKSAIRMVVAPSAPNRVYITLPSTSS